MRAFAYIQNTNVQAFTTATGTVNPGTATHRFGCNRCGYDIQPTSAGINLTECGYYVGDIGATLTASEAATVTLSVYQDGNLLAAMSESVAAASDPVSITVPVGVKVNCNSTLTITVTASTGTPTVNNVQIPIWK